jgi:hypothetical protein
VADIVGYDVWCNLRFDDCIAKVSYEYLDYEMMVESSEYSIGTPFDLMHGVLLPILEYVADIDQHLT